MTELLETRFFGLLAGESFEEITKEDLEDELGKFVEEVAGHVTWEMIICRRAVR